MKKSPNTLLISLMLLGMGIFVLFSDPEITNVLAQMPTGSIPTVTGTPSGILATVRLDQESQINVRSGPGRDYDLVGVLLPGASVPAHGRSSGGDWILIEYLGVVGNEGWVYAPYVSLTPGELPIIIPPPTPTPVMTNTIDPTLAAQFMVTSIPTRLPTFTESVPLVISTYADIPSNTITAGVPFGLIIIVVGGLGILIGLFSMLQT
jgi:hypothetical protein